MKEYRNAPWVSLYYSGSNGYKPCCSWGGDTFTGAIEEYFKSDFLNNIKRDDYDYEYTCRECIKVDSINTLSTRTNLNKHYAIEDGIQSLDYRPTNKCNLACKTCTPRASSLIAKLRDKDVVNLGYNDIIDYDFNLKKLKILGGEPSIEDLSFEAIEKFGNTNTEISITTNGMGISNRWLTALKSCKSLGINISIDGTEKVFEYIRYPGKWDKIKRNIQIYEDNFKSKDMKFHLTVSVFNYLVIDKWLDYFMESNIKLLQYPLTYPEWQSLDIIPPEIKDLIFDYLYSVNHKYAFKAIEILEASIFRPELLRSFQINILKQDKLYKDNLFNVDPRFKALMNYD